MKASYNLTHFFTLYKSYVINKVFKNNLHVFSKNLE